MREGGKELDRVDDCLAMSNYSSTDLGVYRCRVGIGQYDVLQTDSDFGIRGLDDGTAG